MLIKSNCVKDEKIKVSLKVLIDGGADKFNIEKMNHQKEIFGEIKRRPFNERIFREWEFIYKIVIRKNKLDEVKPWAIIIRIAAVVPISLNVKEAEITKPIWATEE